MSPQLIGLVPYEDGVEAPTEPLWPQLIGLVGERVLQVLDGTLENSTNTPGSHLLRFGWLPLRTRQ